MLRFDEQHLLAVCGNEPSLGLNYDYFTTRGGDVEIRRVGGLALRHGIRELILFVLIRDALARKVGGIASSSPDRQPFLIAFFRSSLWEGGTQPRLEVGGSV